MNENNQVIELYQESPEQDLSLAPSAMANNDIYTLENYQVDPFENANNDSSDIENYPKSGWEDYVGYNMEGNNAANNSIHARGPFVPIIDIEGNQNQSETAPLLQTPSQNILIDSSSEESNKMDTPNYESNNHQIQLLNDETYNFEDNMDEIYEKPSRKSLDIIDSDWFYKDLINSDSKNKHWYDSKSENLQK